MLEPSTRIVPESSAWSDGSDPDCVVSSSSPHAVAAKTSVSPTVKDLAA